MGNLPAGAAGEKGTGHATAPKPAPEPATDEQGMLEQEGHLPSHRGRDSGCSSAISSLACSLLISRKEPQRDPSYEYSLQRQQVETALHEREEACHCWEAQLAQENSELDNQWEPDQQDQQRLQESVEREREREREQERRAGHLEGGA